MSINNNNNNGLIKENYISIDSVRVTLQGIYYPKITTHNSNVRLCNISRNHVRPIISLICIYNLKDLIKYTWYFYKVEELLFTAEQTKTWFASR